MGRKGPLFTLLGGALLGVALVAVNLHAGTGRPARPSAAAVSPSPAPQPSSPAPVPAGASLGAAPASPPAGALGRATYAGYTTGGAATVAIAVRDGVAVAYLCDGKKVEAWLRGTAAAGTLSLTGTHSSRLDGSYANGVATGEVTVSGKRWTFRARSVHPPSGLYRSTATVRSAKVENGWIVIDGRQVGVSLVDGVPQAASTLDVNTRTAVVDGETVTAELMGQ